MNQKLNRKLWSVWMHWAHQKESRNVENTKVAKELMPQDVVAKSAEPNKKDSVQAKRPKGALAEAINAEPKKKAQVKEEPSEHTKTLATQVKIEQPIERSPGRGPINTDLISDDEDNVGHDDDVLRVSS